LPLYLSVRLSARLSKSCQRMFMNFFGGVGYFGGDPDRDVRIQGFLN